MPLSDKVTFYEKYRSKCALLVRPLLTLTTFLVVYLLVDYFVLSSVARVVVEMESSIDTRAQLYYSTAVSGEFFTEKHTTGSLPVKAGEKVSLRFDLGNEVVRKLRLDPGEAPGSYRIHSIRLMSFFGDPLTILPQDEAIRMSCGPDTRCQKQAQAVEVLSTGDDPYLIVRNTISINNNIIRFFVPALVAFIAYFASSYWDLRTCRLWRDVHEKKPSSGINYNGLDGLRGMAALFVLADHTGLPGCNGFGMVGVVIFFCLSGFLLTMPFARESSKILSRDYVSGYFYRRLKRIVPMFYVILVVSYLIQGREGDFVRSALFLQGHSILWTVLQEVHFYVLLPLVLLVCHLLLRDRKLLIVLCLLPLSLAYNYGLIATHRIYGLGNLIPLYAGLFLGGIMTCYLLNIDRVRQARVVQKICGSPLFNGLVFVLLITLGHLLIALGVVQSPLWVLSGSFNYLVGLLVFIIVVDENSLLARMFSFLPLRIVGAISYSFYLLHPICLKIIKEVWIEQFHWQLDGVERFLTTLVFTLLLSSVTYTFIERPLIGGLSRPRSSAG